MSFLIQHGWGKGSGGEDKIRRSLTAKLASGVIFGPDAELPESLAHYIDNLRGEFPAAEVLIDPQTYVATLDNPNYKRLVKYEQDYFEFNLHQAEFSPRFVQRLVKRCFDWQLERGVSAIICPGVRIQGFKSRWAQIALNLVQESHSYKQQEGIEASIYPTLAVSQESFSDFQAVKEFLDELTGLEVEGFYFVLFQPGTEYRRAVDASLLPAVLYMLWALGEANPYRVIVGYADMNGLLYRAAGATDFASGWSHNLRRLSEERWTGGPGGRRALTRYTSLQLLNSIPINPDLRRIFEQGQIEKVVAATDLDQVFLQGRPPQDVSWGELSYHMQYLYVCSRLEATVSARALTERCRAARSAIVGASRLYAELQDEHNIQFSRESGPSHVGIWQMSLDEFCRMTQTSL